jgi:Flp pilus assembly protein TadB
MSNVVIGLVALIVGFILGWVLAWPYWRGRVRQREDRARRLRADLSRRELALADARVQSDARQVSAERLSGQVRQDEKAIGDLKTQL